MSIPRFAPLTPFAWTASVGLHIGAAYVLLLGPPASVAPPHRSEVSFSVVTPRRSAPVQSTPTPKPDVPTRVVAKRPATAAAAPLKTPPQAAVPPSGPVDLTGLTLTAGDGATWASMTGNGQAMDAPIRATVAAPPSTNKGSAVAARTTATRPVAPPEVVPVRDLAQKPLPPSLNAALLTNYPPDAKRQGLPGKAVVQARIDSDGIVRKAQVFSESSPGFGTACQRTLLGSSWSAPRDHEGKAVTTQIYYTCDFRVDG